MTATNILTFVNDMHSFTSIVMLLASDIITLMYLNLITYCMSIYKCVSSMNLVLCVLYYIYIHCGHAWGIASTNCYN